MCRVIRSRLALGPGALLVGLLACCLPACESGGHFTLLGYTSRPNYDCTIHTVYVPIFENRTFWRGLEFEVTQAVIREVEAKTPYKVVSDRDKADTELLGTIIVFTKSILNRDQYNQIREGETLLTANVVWRNLHTGEILSRPGKPLGAEPPPVLGVPLSNAPNTLTPGTSPISAPTPPTSPIIPTGDDAPGAPLGQANAIASGSSSLGLPCPPGATTVGIPISSLGYFVPELGGSISTAQQQNANRLAIQIVSMMEKPW